MAMVMDYRTVDYEKVEEMSEKERCGWVTDSSLLQVFTILVKINSLKMRSEFFFICIFLSVTPLLAQLNSPPLKIECLLPYGKIYTRQTGNSWVSCLADSSVEMTYSPSASASVFVSKTVPPVCKWYNGSSLLATTSEWSGKLFFSQSSELLFVTVQCSSTACSKQPCSFEKITVEVTNQDIHLFILLPPPPYYEFQTVQFAWCAKMMKPDWSYTLSTNGGTPSRVVLNANYYTQIDESLYPPGLKLKCAPYYNYKVTVLYENVGEYAASLSVDSGPPVNLQVSLDVEPLLLHILSAKSEVINVSQRVKLSWKVSAFSDLLVYQLVTENSEINWSLSYNPFSVMNSLCQFPLSGGPNTALQILAETGFLMKGQNYTDVAGIVTLSNGIFGITQNGAFSYITLGPRRNQDSIVYFSNNSGLYYSWKENTANAASMLGVYYIFFQEQGLGYLFNIVFTDAYLYTFTVDVYLNRMESIYKSLQEIDIEIHLYNSGPADVNNAIFIVWFIPVQHPFLQCLWKFSVAFAKDTDATSVDFTYTYNGNNEYAHTYIPNVVLPFDRLKYVGFVGTGFYRSTGVKPFTLTVTVGSYGFKTIKSVVYCQKSPCLLSKASIQKPNHPIPVITSTKGSSLVLYASLNITCSAVKEITLVWNFYNVPNTTTQPNWTDYLDIPQTWSVDQTLLNIPKWSLNYGLYLVNFTADIRTSDAKLPFFSISDFVFLNVGVSDLSAVISGGSYRTVGYNTLWIINGSSSADPDSRDPLDGLSFVWYCTKSVTEYETLTFNKLHACHPDQSSLIWPATSDPVVTMYPQKLAGNEKYYFRLTVRKKTRESHAYQTIHVLLGSPPEVMITCIENCGKILIPTERFSLSGKCLDCTVETQEVYQWSLFTQDDSEIEFDWDTATSTGRFSGYISIKALSFLNFSEKMYTLQLMVSTWSGVSSTVKYSFYVNDPPRHGTCNITPNRGIALETKFTIECKDFVDISVPLMYRIIAITDNANIATISSLQDNSFGSIIYMGYDAKCPQTVLPSGIPSEKYMLTIYVQVIDDLGTFTQVHLSAKVEKPHIMQNTVVNYLQNLTQGPDSWLSSFANEHNFLEAQKMTYVIATVLNHYAIDSEGKSVPDLNSKIKLRESLLKASSAVPMGSAAAINQVAISIAEVTEVEEELSLHSLKLAIEKLQEASAVLTEYAHEGIGSEITDRLAATILTALSNTVTASLLQMTEIDTTVDKSKAAGNIEVIENMFSAVESLTKSVLHGKVPGENDTLMQTKSSYIIVKKEDKQNIESSFLIKTDCINCFYPQLGNDYLPSDAVINAAVYNFKQNPFPWLSNGENISTDVSGLSMTAESTDGTFIDVTPEVIEVVMRIKERLPTVNITVKPDKLSPGLSSGEFCFETELQEGNEVFLQFLTHLHATFKASIFIGNTSAKGLLVGKYLIPQNISDVVTDVSEVATFFAKTRYRYILQIPYTSLVNSEVQRRGSNRTNITALLQSSDINISNDTLIEIVVFYANCLNFDKLSENWNQKSCKVGPLTTYENIHCICKHTAAAAGKRMLSPTKISAEFIAGKVFVMPHIVDIRKTPVLFKTLHRNMIPLIAVFSVLGIYAALVIWVLKKKKVDDLCRDRVIILPDNDPFDRFCYLVTVYTGSRFGAGTTADVFITLNGRRGQSDVHHLKHPTIPALYRGGVNTFLLTTKVYLGDLVSIRFWHNNSGYSPEWFLSRVKVENMYTKEVWYFMCQKWLSASKDDKLLDWTFSAISISAPIARRDFFQISLAFGLENHMLFSVFSSVVSDSFNRLQRLSCCLTMLMSILLTSIMFFKKESFQEDTWEVYVKSIIVSIESALISVPVHLLTTGLFKHSHKEQEVALPSPDHHSNEQKLTGDYMFSWMFYLQPRNWKDRLKMCYLIESIKELPENNLEISKIQTLDPKSIQHLTNSNKIVPESLMKRKTHLNCVVTESLVGAVTIDYDHQIAAMGAVYHKENGVHLTSQKCFIQSEKHKQKGNDEQIILASKPKLILPHWCIYFAWAAVVIVTLVSSFFIILYGLSYGKTISLAWLFASAFSFLQSTFIVEPAKIALLSVIHSVIRNTCNKLSWITRCNILEFRLNEVPKNIDEMRQLHFEFIKMRKGKVYQPLNEDELRIARKRGSTETNATAYLKCVMSHFIILVLVTYLANFHENVNYFYNNQIIQHQFSFAFLDVKDINSIYTWLTETFLTQIHNDKKTTFLNNSRAKILGLPRMRQVRAAKENVKCFQKYIFVYLSKQWNIQNAMFTYLSKLWNTTCQAKYGPRFEDHNSYFNSWQNIDKTSTEKNIYRYNGYVYEPPILPWTYISPGKFHYYSPGGYTVYFFPEDQLSDSIKKLHQLVSSSWIDKYTWSVIMELTTFNPDVNLFCTISVAFEMSPFGRIYKTVSVNSFHLPVFTPKEWRSISSDIIIIGILMIFIINEVRTIVKEKGNYIKRISNLMNLLQTVMLMLMVCLLVVKHKMGADLLNFYLLNPNQFIPFHAVSAVHQALRMTNAILVFFTISRTVIYARCFHDVRLAQKSITTALPIISSVGIILSIYISAYIMFGYLVFGQYEWRFSTLSNTIQTVVSYCIFEFNSADFTSKKILGGCYIFSFVIFMACALINVFHTVVIAHYEGVKKPVYEEPCEEAEAVAFLICKARHIWNSLKGKEYTDNEPDTAIPMLYGKGEKYSAQQNLGMKAKNVHGQKFSYLLI
ncbi:polycystic kidney disease and receptor for egg jelly-related protein [Protopterus annectens]|uniref:polycystic kidney disease and receptor for egg jelly-related protein n=1 Tax=Protopterus annectens TaxID=7888 RepID=UPI001CFAD4C7|nr:polycystic kidney disease and receptor for egg jelly-related protein [Protopterus annectens]